MVVLRGRFFDSFKNMHSTNRVKINGELNPEDYNDVIPKISILFYRRCLDVFMDLGSILGKKSMVF